MVIERLSFSLDKGEVVKCEVLNSEWVYFAFALLLIKTVDNWI